MTQVDPETKSGRRHDLGTRQRRRAWPPAPTASGSATAAGERLVRLDPDFPSAARSIELGRTRGFDFAAVNPVAVGQGAVWAAGRQWRDRTRRSHEPPDRRQDPGRQQPDRDRHGRRRRLGRRLDRQHRDPDRPGRAPTRSRRRSRSGRAPSAIAVGEGAVWVANTQDDTVSRIDPRSAAVTQTIPVGAGPTGIAAAGGAVWVANSLGGTVSRIDPEANRVEATVEVGEAPQGVTVAHGLVWVTVQASAEAPDGARARGRRGDRAGGAARPRRVSTPQRLSRDYLCDLRAALQLPRPPLPRGLSASARGGGGGAARIGWTAGPTASGSGRASASRRPRTSP